MGGVEELGGREDIGRIEDVGEIGNMDVELSDDDNDS
jgi:hypothetical protein